MELAYRLLVALGVLVAPTLLYVGLLRGLRWLRNDALLARIAERDDVSPELSRFAADATGTAPVRVDGGDPAASAGTCPNCGERNRPETTYCRRCVTELQ